MKARLDPMSDPAPSTPSGGTQLDRIEAKLDRLQGELDRVGPLLGSLPDLIATLGNTLDDVAARDGNAKFDARLRAALTVLLRLGDPALLAALERLLDPRIMQLLAELGAELPNAAAAPSEDHGVLGLLGVLREDEVQRALSFVVHLGRRFGRVLDERETQP